MRMTGEPLTVNKQPYHPMKSQVDDWAIKLVRTHIKSKKKIQTCPSSHGNVTAIHSPPELGFLKAQYAAESLAGGAHCRQSDRGTEGRIQNRLQSPKCSFLSQVWLQGCTAY